MEQQSFLRLAKRELGLSYQELAVRLGVSARTIEKWSLTNASPDRREMPRIAVKFISLLLEDAKRTRILSGDRAGAEVIDALLSHVDPDKLRDCLRTFDALQRSAARLIPAARSARKPRYFVTLQEKNEWERKEELENARRIRQARAFAR